MGSGALSTIPATNGPKYVGQNPTTAITAESTARPTYKRRGVAGRAKVAVVAMRFAVY